MREWLSSGLQNRVHGFESHPDLIRFSKFQNMKNIAPSIFIALFITFVSVNPVNAQDFTAQKAFEDYQFQHTIYTQKEAEYQDAKTFYKKNPTLQLREEARKKTLEMLIQRDQLMATYLTALRVRLAETTGLTPEEKGGTFSKLDPEVLWYETHKGNYLEGDELATLFSKSDESKVRYQTLSRYVIYEALFYISLSEEIGSRLDHQVIYTDLKNFLNDRVAENTLRIDPFNRWLNDTDAVLVTLSKNETLSRERIANLYRKNYTPTSTYGTALQILLSSVKPLNQLNNYLTELLISIDTQLK